MRKIKIKFRLHNRWNYNLKYRISNDDDTMGWIIFGFKKQWLNYHNFPGILFGYDKDRKSTILYLSIHFFGFELYSQIKGLERQTTYKNIPSYEEQFMNLAKKK